MSLTNTKIIRFISIITCFFCYGLLHGQLDTAVIKNDSTKIQQLEEFVLDTLAISILEKALHSTKLEMDFLKVKKDSLEKELLTIDPNRKKFFTKKNIFYGTVGLIVPTVYLLAKDNEKVKDDPIGFPPSWKDNP